MPYRRRSCSSGTTVKIIVYAILIYIHHTKADRTEKNKGHTNCTVSNTNRVNIFKYTKINSSLHNLYNLENKEDFEKRVKHAATNGSHSFVRYESSFNFYVKSQP